MAKQVVNGVSYKPSTSKEVIRILETARASHARLSITYGNTTTGKSYETVQGYIDRTAAEPSEPLLLNSRKSSGGTVIKDGSILSISDPKKGVLYSWLEDEELMVEETIEDAGGGETSAPLIMSI